MTELIELRERGVKIRLVEDLVPVRRVALDGEKLDLPPLGLEALRRSAIGHTGDHCSRIVEPMHGDNVSAQV